MHRMVWYRSYSMPVVSRHFVFCFQIEGGDISKVPPPHILIFVATNVTFALTKTVIFVVYKCDSCETCPLFTNMACCLGLLYICFFTKAPSTTIKGCMNQKCKRIHLIKCKYCKNTNFTFDADSLYTILNKESNWMPCLSRCKNAWKLHVLSFGACHRSEVTFNRLHARNAEKTKAAFFNTNGGLLIKPIMQIYQR